MKVKGIHYRSLWWDRTAQVLCIIDQRALPHVFRVQPVATLDDFVQAICQMRVRGAPDPSTEATVHHTIRWAIATKSGAVSASVDMSRPYRPPRRRSVRLSRCSQ